MDPKRRTKTTPGLGETGGVPRYDSEAIRRPKTTTIREEEGAETAGREEHLGRAPVSSNPPPRSVRPPISATPPPPRVPRHTPPGWEAEAATGTRRKRPSREPLKIDTVGDAAVKMAKPPLRAPRLLVDETAIAKAPIDQRAAFLLSLVDGQSDVETIIAAAAMPDDEARTTLERLARLGLVALP